MRGPDPHTGEGEDLFRTEHAASRQAAEALARRLRQAQRGGPAVVDVRDAEAHSRLRVEGAYHLPPEEVEEAAARLPEDTLLYVYGEDHASAEASRVTLLLAQEGLRVQEVHGGLQALREAGAPLAGHQAPEQDGHR